MIFTSLIVLTALILEGTMAFTLPSARLTSSRQFLFGGGGGGEDKPQGGGGLGGMMDNMKKMNEIQKKTKEMQEDLASERVTGESADGKIKITFNGAQEALDCSIEDAKLGEGGATVAAAVIEAIKDGQAKSTQVMMKKMQTLYSSMGLPNMGQ